MAVERTELRQKFDRFAEKMAPASFWAGAAVTGLALATGAYPVALVGGLNMYSDLKTQEGKGKPPEKQSAFSMQSMLDKMGIGVKGSDRFNSSSTRLDVATGPA